LKKQGFPVLNREPFVEALIKYSVKNFDGWIPPHAFKKYVSSEDVLAMFPERKDNSELIRKSDLDRAITFLDLDDSSDTSLSDYEVQSSGRDEVESREKCVGGTENSSAEKERKRPSTAEEQERCPSKGTTERTDGSMEGTSDQVTETSNKLVRTATLNGMRSPASDEPVRKRRRKDKANSGDDDGLNEIVRKVPKADHSADKPEQVEGPDVKNDRVPRTSHSEKGGNIGLLKAFSPIKKR
ncbi:hypothetical protein OSTOST_10266, partial [Ostertagia ostertagi]